MSSLVWRFAEFEFDENSRELRRNGLPLSLESKPREVLLYLLRRSKEVVTPAEIQRAVWSGIHVSAPTVPVALKKIRDAFGDGDRERIVRTVKGQGYAVAVEVTCIGAVPESAEPELHIGEPVPGRPGWLLTQRLHADQHGAAWLSKLQFGEQRRLVRLAWTPEGLRRLAAEAELLLAVHASGGGTACFPRIFEFSEQVVPYLLETDCGGMTLPLWAASQGGLHQVSESTRIDLVAQVAAGLQALSAVGYVYGDLCAGNLSVHPRGEGWSVRFENLGRYMPLQSDAIDAGTCWLIPQARPEQPGIFRAPELSEGEATQAGDLYALGVLLYQLTACNLTEAPGPGWQARVVDPVLQDDIAETANLDPRQRRRTPGDLARDLRELAGRRHVQETLRSSQRDVELAQQQLAAELAKAPLRRALLVAVAFIVLLASATAVLQSVRLRQARDQAHAQKQDADTLQIFLQQLFFDGDVAAHGALSAEDLAQRGLSKAKYLEARPAAHAALLNTLGAGFESLGDHTSAETALAEALTERTRLFGAHSPEVAETLVQQAVVQDEEQHPGAALAMAQRALVIQQQTLPPDDIAITRTRTYLAEFWTDLGQYDNATSLLQGAIRREMGHPDLLPDLSTALNDLSIDENYLGRLPESIALQQQSLAIDRQLLGDNHPDIAEHLESLSNAHDLLGMFGIAAEEAREALTIFKGWLPPGHHDLAAAHAHLATELAHDPASLNEARLEVELALAGLAREPERSSTEAYAESTLGLVLFQQQHYPEALTAYRRSLQIYQTVYPKPHLTWTVPLDGIAAILYREHDWSAFEQAAGAAAKAAYETLPVGDFRRLESSLLLAHAREHEGRMTEAQDLLDEVYSQSTRTDARTRSLHLQAQAELEQSAPRNEVVSNERR